MAEQLRTSQIIMLARISAALDPLNCTDNCRCDSACGCNDKENCCEHKCGCDGKESSDSVSRVLDDEHFQKVISSFDADEIKTIESLQKLVKSLRAPKSSN